MNAEVPGRPAGLAGRLAPSDRLRLAALARDAALSTPGVDGLDPGPTRTFFTAGAGELVLGVNCVAAPEGGYDLSLQLVCEIVPLHLLADRVRTAIDAAATEAGLIVQTVTIRITDIVDPAAVSA